MFGFELREENLFLAWKIIFALWERADVRRLALEETSYILSVLLPRKFFTYMLRN